MRTKCLRDAAAFPKGTVAAKCAALAALAAVAVGVGVVVSPWGERPGADFYDTASQIIPVLLVALAVEGSARELWVEVPEWIPLYTFVVLLAGELSAIVAAAGVIAEPPVKPGSPLETYVGPGRFGTDILMALTIAGLVVGFLLVMYIAFIRGAAQTRESHDPGYDVR